MQVLPTHPGSGAAAFAPLLPVQLVWQCSSHATVMPSAAVQTYSYDKPSYAHCGHTLQLHSRHTLMLPFSMLNETLLHAKRLLFDGQKLPASGVALNWIPLGIYLFFCSSMHLLTVSNS